MGWSYDLLLGNVMLSRLLPARQIFVSLVFMCPQCPEHPESFFPFDVIGCEFQMIINE